MEKKDVVRFKIEETETQIARRHRSAKDGAVEVFLTRQHARVLVAVGKACEAGWNPTFRELQETCKYGTPTGVRRAVIALGGHGLVETNIRSSRSIRLTKTGRAVYELWKDVPIRRRVKA